MRTMPVHTVAARLLTAAVCACLLMTACSKETEEDRVKKVITSVQQAAEEKDIGAVLDHVSKSYNDPQGNNYDGVKGLLAFYFFRHPKVSVYVPAVEVTVSDTAAEALFQAVLTGRDAGGSATKVLPESLGIYNFEVSLRKEKGEWKVISAKWERAGEDPTMP